MSEVLTADAKTTLKVLFFGRVGDVFGSSLQVPLPEGGCTVAELRRRIAELTGEAMLLKPGVRASIDREIVGEDARVAPGAEVAFFSLFSGG
jgi:molybdopterin converting factor small subunit